jgi:hypothetical protein
LLPHKRFHSVDPSRVFLARQLSLNFVVLLVELVQLDPAHHILAVVGQVVSLEVEFSFKLKHKYLLALANCDACRPCKTFDLVYLYLSISCLLNNFSPFCCQPLLSEVSVITFFPVPITLVPY